MAPIVKWRCLIPEPIFIEPIIPAGRERSCLKKEWALPFLEMRCNIFETIYFNPSPYLSPLGGEGEG